MAQPGSALPDVTLYEGSPDDKVTLTKLFQGKKGILFGVPGAYTPGCSKTHLPGYVSDFDKLSQAGAQIIACVSVNDPFVMAAWGEFNKASGKVHMLADPQGELARALGVEIDTTAMLGNKRCKRFSAVIEDGKIKTFNVEPDGTGLTCSLSNTILKQLA